MFYSIAEITSVEPKVHPGFFDKCKEEIAEWQSAGLDEKSFVKCHSNNLHNIRENMFCGKIGELEPDDLLKVLTKITQINL